MQKKLLFQLDLVRHGDRAPQAELSGAESLWDGKLGQLTDRGRLQKKQSGQALRSELIDQHQLLAQEIHHEQLWIRCSDFHRTQESAQMMLQGLYPNQDFPKFLVIPLHQEKLLIPFCEDAQKAKAAEELLWDQFQERYEHRFKALHHALGVDFTHRKTLIQWADLLKIRRLHQKPLPEGVSLELAQEIDQLGNEAFVQTYQCKEITGTTGKYLLETVQSFFRKRRFENTPLRYVLLSGHDVTIMTLLTTLNLPLQTVPPYAARVSIRLWEQGTHHEVEIVYQGKTLNVESSFCHFLLQ